VGPLEATPLSYKARPGQRILIYNTICNKLVAETRAERSNTHENLVHSILRMNLNICYLVYICSSIFN